MTAEHNRKDDKFDNQSNQHKKPHCNGQKSNGFKRSSRKHFFQKKQKEMII